MATTNPITGDTIATKVNSDSYRDNWDRIFNRPVEALGERPDIDPDDEALKELEKTKCK